MEIGTADDGRDQRQILYATRHRTQLLPQIEHTAIVDDMSRARHTNAGGLDTSDAIVVRRPANRAAPIRTDIKRGTTRSNNGSSATGRSRGAACQVIGIV